MPSLPGAWIDALVLRRSLSNIATAVFTFYVVIVIVLVCDGVSSKPPPNNDV